MKKLILICAVPFFAAFAQFTLPSGLGLAKWSGGEDIITGLLAHYPLDEVSGDALDTSGNSRTMTQVGTVPATSPGRGPFTVSDYFTRSDVALDLTASDWTICGWFNLSTIGGSQALISHEASPILTWGVYAYNSGFSNTMAGAVIYHASGGGNTTVSAPGSAITTGALHFLCATFNNGTLLLSCSLDNGSVGSATASTPATQSNATQIGRATIVFPLLGTAQHVRIYNRVLTAPQISRLYNSGTPN